MKLKQRILLCVFIVCILLPFLWLRSLYNLYKEEGYPLITEKSSKSLDETLDFNRINHEAGVLGSYKRVKRTSESESHKSKSNLKKNADSSKDYTKDKNGPTDYEFSDPWQIWSDMVKNRQLTPKENDENDDVGMILEALSYKPIIAAGIGHRGTQLKATLILEGHQRVVFKPMRYPRDHIIHGKPYDGFDRHNGEIAAFHLDRVLGFYRAPPVVGRTVHLADEIQPIGDKRLLDTFFHKDGNTCFYGVCHYCKRSEAACANGTLMEGSVTAWLPSGWNLVTSRHPWQRTYREGRKAHWEIDNNYCQKVMKKPPYNTGPRLLDIMDTAIFDFLIGNADRHHYETFKKDGDNGMLIHLDNAKSGHGNKLHVLIGSQGIHERAHIFLSLTMVTYFPIFDHGHISTFGNPHHDEISILAPVYQCCRIRLSTWLRLVKLNKDRVHPLSTRLRKAMDLDPVAPVLTELHLTALDRRLGTALNVVRKCIEKKGKRNVLIKNEF